jgi:hypothetical protein
MSLNKEKVKRNLESILEKMHTGADIAQLHEYHKLYRKEISFFKRSWAAAWLLMYYDQRETPRFPAKISPEKQNTEITLGEEESKRLFISIGKNRRLFPRDVISLIMTKTSVAREDIGVIRILDNYSFVQVRDIKADEIIEKLTGQRFRGRTLTVNYAKPKMSDNENE